MKPLLRLRPYLAKYKTTLLWGLLTVVMSNLFTVAQPLFVGNAIDSLKASLQSGQIDGPGLLKFAGLIVLFPHCRFLHFPDTPDNHCCVATRGVRPA